MPRFVAMIALFSVACGGDDPQIQEDIEDVDAIFEVLLPDSVTFDTALPDTTQDTTPDITPGCSGFGCPCQGNGDCDSGVCIESADGLICTLLCSEECPTGYDCVSGAIAGQDGLSVCVPRHTRLCRPCRAHAECQSPSDPNPAFCLPAQEPAPAGSAGSFCGSSCATRACPAGYDCEDVDVGGVTARQCVPQSGLCDCRESWTGLGFSTTCDVTNAFGTCVGSRGCEANGLSACVGPQPAPEVCDDIDNDCNGRTDDLPETACYVTNEFGTCPGHLVCDDDDTPVCGGLAALPESCNGIDDDCDGATDELTCDDGLSCTSDVCAAPFQCVNALIAGHCLIEGACAINGQYNPTNPCQLCDPNRTSSAWSQAPNTCFIGDGCYPANAVNPLDACQICNPNQSTTAWSTVANTCQIAGQCHGPGESNPNNPCEICAPASSTTTWTQAQNTCNIQGQCFAAGPRAGNPCEVCDPTRNPIGWSNAPSSTVCDDQNACSAQSTCDGAGSCVGDTRCDDGVICTLDVCNPLTGCNHSTVAPGYCRINGVCYTTNTANPANPCERCNPSQSATTWSPQPTTVGCNDNLYCTVNDRCNGTGQCVGEARNCSDGLSCTNDSCNETTDQCVNTLQANQCVISGQCYSNGTTQPNNVCYRCNSASSTSAWSLNNGASCNDGNQCTANDVCSGGTCSGAYIRDAFENNDSVATPYNLGNYTDAQNFPQRTITAPTISGPGDVDWYVYFVDDVWNGDIEPRFRVSSLDPTFVAETCFFFRCTNEDRLPTTLNCTSPGGYAGGSVTYGGKEYAGCCRSGTGSINLKLTTSHFECPSGDDDYRALVRVRTTNNTWSCTAPYTLEIGDD